MADLGVIRVALARQLSAVTGTQVSPYILNNPTPPFIHIYPGGDAGDIEYHQAMVDGVEVWPFTIQAFVADGDIGSQKNLDRYIVSSGTMSIKAALETADDEGRSTLGGLIHNLIVRSCTPYTVFTFDANRASLLGATWLLDVYLQG